MQCRHVACRVCIHMYTCDCEFMIPVNKGRKPRVPCKHIHFMQVRLFLFPFIVGYFSSVSHQLIW